MAQAALKLAGLVALVRNEAEAGAGNGGTAADNRDLAAATKFLEGAFGRLWAIATRHAATPPPAKFELMDALSAGHDRGAA